MAPKVIVGSDVTVPSESIQRLLRTAERLNITIIVKSENYRDIDTDGDWPELVEDPEDD